MSLSKKSYQNLEADRLAFSGYGQRGPPKTEFKQKNVIKISGEGVLQKVSLSKKKKKDNQNLEADPLDFIDKFNPARE